jgi:hypothetical protein
MIAMIIIWSIGLVSGMLLGIRRLSVLMLVPVAAFTIVAAIVSHGQPHVAHLVIGVAMSQLGYLLGILCLILGTYLLATGFKARARLRASHSLKAAQSAIGQDLRVTFEPPQEMPAEMARLLARVGG